MQIVIALFFGLSSGLAATLLHQSLPPLGLILGIFLTYFSTWYVGRYSGKRIYKVISAIAWVVVVMRAGTFGVGQELLIQGDAVGAGITVFGLIALAFAIYRRV